VWGLPTSPSSSALLGVMQQISDVVRSSDPPTWHAHAFHMTTLGLFPRMRAIASALASATHASGAADVAVDLPLLCPPAGGAGAGPEAGPAATGRRIPMEDFIEWVLTLCSIARLVATALMHAETAAERKAALLGAQQLLSAPEFVTVAVLKALSPAVQRAAAAGDRRAWVCVTAAHQLVAALDLVIR
jgi:hypothetical protein